ncbi:MAG: glycosyltransferase [Bacilli bacterium]|nr:glycosyltransferase [Bacilli bacterium]
MRALLIPIYEPTDKVLPFLSQFKQEDFDAFLVVDDGSGEAFRPIFDEVAKTTVFTVHSYEGNKGKGHALKEGIRILLQQYPDLDTIVTADGDGQHSYPDILRVAEKAKECPSAVILGVRDFSKAPPKSASGNKWSARYFFLATHRKVTDCQTGLRALPKESFDMALHTYGERFDYEMNFLLPASREYGIAEVVIQTIYEDDNKGTHFRPVADSLLIMRTPIAYIFVGVTSFAIDIVAFFLFERFVFTNAANDALQLLYCNLCARAISFPYNYFMLDTLVFHHKNIFHHSFYKYLVLAITSVFTAYGLTYLFSRLYPALTPIKIIVSIFLGIVIYFINLMITFANRKFGNKKSLH